MTTNHKSALVTGGGTGIGRAVTARLVSGGYDVTIVGRREDILRRTATELAENGPGTVRIDVADVAASDAPEAVIASHVGAFGGINALVTAAAFYEPIPFLGAGGGRIVLFSSINGFHSEPDSADYSAAKAAVSSLAKSMAVDLGSSGVITNAIAPGWVATPMTQEFLDRSSPEILKHVNPLGRAGDPAEIADVVWFLIEDAPSFLIGTTLYVDGGQTVAAPMP